MNKKLELTTRNDTAVMIKLKLLPGLIDKNGLCYEATQTKG